MLLNKANLWTYKLIIMRGPLNRGASKNPYKQTSWSAVEEEDVTRTRCARRLTEASSVVQRFA